MSWYYVSMLPKMIASRNKELSQIKKGGLKLQWFTPIPDEKIKEAQVGGTFEAYKM
jgi:hypothetical protein